MSQDDITYKTLLSLPNVYRAFYGRFPSVMQVQYKAVKPILEGKDLILQAATGAGKSEAVLAPCMERVIRSGRKEAVLYVQPTRALAFDLIRRFEPVLNDRLGLGMLIRTGDDKRTLGGPPDIMITTPESLDVALGSGNPDIKAFLQKIRTIIIDEVHPLIYTCRGEQLAYLLARLQHRIRHPLQRIALSATIADPDAVAGCFGFRRDAARIREDVSRDIIPRLLHLKDEDGELPALLDDLHDVWGYRKILIFSNSRSRCDRLLGLLEGKGRFRGRTALHYSNLKPRERRLVEKRFRRHRRSVCIATSTLELGIDVGDVDAVILYEPPDTVSAFLQRVGRANRRQEKIHFWGVCRGQNASVQLLRFLAMLNLARRGKIEAALPRRMPSVLCQQVLSLLYERKTAALSHVVSLARTAPEQMQAESVRSMVQFMIRRGWLRKTRFKGLYKGAWRYRDALLEYRIWSNFPETEDVFALEVGGESVADLPVSIVRQFDPGDRVFMAGRRLKILMIHDAGPRKRVTAEPTKDVETKEIAWIGPAGHVSYETARAMKVQLENAGDDPDDAPPGLMTRTGRLYRSICSVSSKTACLDNGIELFVNAAGLYSYRTWLGSIGNWVLELCARQWLEKSQDEEAVVHSDETGIIASSRVIFERLALPVKKSEWVQWVRPRLKQLQSAFPLNAYAQALPKEMLLMEITDKIYDRRVADAFAVYLEATSEITHGSLDAFPSENDHEKTANEIQLPGPGNPFMAATPGAQDAGGDTSLYNGPCDHARYLTGTLIGEFFRLKQCERWMNFQFLSPGHRPEIKKPLDDPDENDMRCCRMEAGREFEADVLSLLKQEGDPFLHISAASEDGKTRQLKERHEETLAQLNHAVDLIKNEGAEAVWISQAVFFIPPSPGIPLMNGYIGIPDLIHLRFDGLRIRLTVGDIKSAVSPRYHHQWQVAFYGWLIQNSQASAPLPPFSLSERGFLLNRSREAETLFTRHEFDLAPFFSAMPFLYEKLKLSLSMPVDQAAHQVTGHCIQCDFFTFCLSRMQSEEPVQFISGLTPGDLMKLRLLDISTLREVSDQFRGEAAPVLDIFSPERAGELGSRASSLLNSQAFIAESHTRLFPSNTKTFIILYGVPDGVVRLPAAIGIRAAGRDASEFFFHSTGDKDYRGLWGQFSKALKEMWDHADSDRHFPQIIFFDQAMRRLFLNWAEAFNNAFLLHLLENRFEPFWTDISRVVHRHFYLPVPGRVTLYALNRLLGLGAEIAEPESCFHPDEQWEGLPDETEAIGEWVGERLILIEKIWKWISARLTSEQQREFDLDAYADPDSMQYRYHELVEAEKKCHDADKVALKRMTFQERAARFRAVGPLVYSGSLLNDEGRFLYRFTLPENMGPSKFRSGDFLQLVPETCRDIEDGYPVILEEFMPDRGTLLLKGRKPRLSLMQGFRYTLEEDFSDWNTPKLRHVLNFVFSPKLPHPLADLLKGEWDFEQPDEHRDWCRQWLEGEGKRAGLNPAQQNALALPFSYALSMVQGRPEPAKPICWAGC